ncbi:uncharacterized protein [Amphiura filiformis]|uniref:uncharacterized protein n=1 Tax=Amphiura filiformis TaxID=82378 RepID=UPI003B20FACA
MTMFIVVDTMTPSLKATLSSETDEAQTEGGVVSVIISRNGDTRSCCSADINTDLSTATDNVDFSLPYAKLNFNPGQYLQYVNLILTDDNLHEPRERITLQLYNSVGATVVDGEVTVTLLDDDDLFGFETTQYVIDEANGSQDIIITRQGELADTVSGRVTLQTGTAQGMIDFDNSIQEFTFLPNIEKLSVIITVYDDNITEGAEMFSLNLELTRGHGIIDENRNTVTVTIIDDESPPPTTEPMIIGSCQQLQCKNGASCGNNNGRYVCECTQGYQGDDCSEQTTATWFSTTNILIIAGVGIVIIVILILAAFCCYKKRKASVKRSRTISQQGIVTNDYLTPMGQSNPQFELWEVPTLDSESRQCEIQRSRIRLHEVIGSGAFGEVYLATARNIGRDRELSHVAVKVLKDSKEQSSDFMKELKFLQSLDPHPNIIGFIGCCTDKEPYYLVLEYAPNGNLREYLHSIRKEPGEQVLQPKEIIGFAFDVSKGMEYISSKNCVHRDLATRNILLGKENVCKLSDFGLARDMETKHQYEMKSDSRVPVRWLAPESIKDNKYSIKTDVWSFGIVLWELVTMGAHPYAGMNAKQVVKMVCDGERLDKPDHCNDAIYNFMLKCWNDNPKRRPDFHDIRTQLEIMKADANGYLKMKGLNKGSYVYLERQKWEKNTKETV